MIVPMTEKHAMRVLMLTDVRRTDAACRKVACALRMYSDGLTAASLASMFGLERGHVDEALNRLLDGEHIALVGRNPQGATLWRLNSVAVREFVEDWQDTNRRSW